MKKFLTILIAVVTMTVNLGSSIFADDVEEASSFFMTSEPTMPELTSTSKIGDSYSRSQWVEDVIEYNEQYYSQEVVNWYETENSYVFEFGPRDISTVMSNASVSDDIYLGIHMIEYIKPESDLTMTVNSTTYVDKFTYYYGFSGSYTSIDSKYRTTYQVFKTLTINIASTVSKTAGTLMEIVTGVAEATFDLARPASLKTYNQYMYYNKVCSVKPSNGTTWFPTCQIGKRYAFTKEIHSVYHSNGYLDEDTTYTYEWDGYSVPPRSGQYAEVLTKSHYDDGRWMIQKAIETINTGGYVDVYGLATNVDN